MPSNSEPLWRDVSIVNELGLHARAAAKVAKVAQQASGRVWLHVGSEQIDAKQIMDILTLAAARGDQLRVTIETAADTGTLNLIAELFAGGFGE